MWLRCCVDNHECIATHEDDVIIRSKDPKCSTCVLTNEHDFKLKGSGPMSHHLGSDFGRDDNGIIHFISRKNIKKIINYYLNMLGSNPKLNFLSP